MGKSPPAEGSHAGRLIQYTLEQGNNRENQASKIFEARAGTWQETCVALRMTPQRSPFLWSNAGAGVEMYGRI